MEKHIIWTNKYEDRLEYRKHPEKPDTFMDEFYQIFKEYQPFSNFSNNCQVSDLVFRHLASGTLATAAPIYQPSQQSYKRTSGT